MELKEQPHQLSMYLAPKNECPVTGCETGDQLNHGISHFKDPYGSNRLVKYQDGVAIAALQIVATKATAVAANVYTHPDYRRAGAAKELYEYALAIWPKLEFAAEEFRSPMGMAWTQSIIEKKNLNRIQDARKVIPESESPSRKPAI